MRLVLITADVIVSEGAFVCAHAKAVAFACLWRGRLRSGVFASKKGPSSTTAPPADPGTSLLINVLLGGISKGGETISQVVSLCLLVPSMALT